MPPSLTAPVSISLRISNDLDETLDSLTLGEEAGLLQLIDIGDNSESPTDNKDRTPLLHYYHLCQAYRMLFSSCKDSPLLKII